MTLLLYTYFFANSFEGKIITISTGGEQPNRLFIIIAVALLGLVCIGLVGLGGVIYLLRTNQAQQAAVPTPTLFVPIPTPTLTSTPTSTHTPIPPPTPTGTPVVVINGQEVSSPETNQAPTDTPPPTEEPTQEPTQQPTEEPEVTLTDTPTPLQATSEPPEASPTNTLVVQQPPEDEADTTPTSLPEMPEGGNVLSTHNNHFLMWAGVGLLLLLLVGIISHLRSSSRTS
jgi:hypothetical protein